MIKVIISGYGKMGHMVERALAERGVELVCATEDVRSVDKAIAAQCVCIDFTTPAAFRENFRDIASKFKAAVVGTTGWYDIKDEVFKAFEDYGTPLIWASNFSVGVNVMTAAVTLVAKYLGKAGGYSPYMVEKHHCHKLDAPSGTAKTLAAAVEAQMGGRVEISSVRAGEIPGIHTVTFEGLSDRLTIEHEAFSRKGFAEGAVTAALLTEGLSGCHEFSELFFAQNPKKDINRTI